MAGSEFKIDSELPCQQNLQSPREYHDPAERTCLRLLYRDWHPTRLGKLVTHALAWMSGVGLTPPILLTLQVKGRRSGRLHDTILVVTEYGGQRYLVSMLGDGSDWVRNLRAAGGRAFVKRGRSSPVRLTEVPVSERAPILKAYCQVATSGREHFRCRTTRRSPISMAWQSTIPSFVSF